MTHFEFYDIPMSFEVDKESLRKIFFEKQQKVSSGFLYPGK